MTAYFGRFTIRADGLSGSKATEYEATVVGILRSYAQWRAGKAVLRAVSFYNKPILIHPYFNKADPCNALGGGDRGGLLPNTIAINPQDWTGPSRCYPNSAGGDPHEVLLHELVHAARTAGGVATPGPREEAVAIVVANVFAAERNRPIRNPANHDSMAPYPSDPAGFLRQYTPFLSSFYHQMPDFFRWIAEINVSYNPVRLYYQNVLTGVPRLNSA